MFDFKKFFKPRVSRIIPVDEKFIKDTATKFKFISTFSCVSCPAKITIRSTFARGFEASNFQGIYTPELCAKLKVETKFIGHSILPSGMLNWLGLLEERGWKTNPVICPACQRGMTIDQYKEAKRNGLI